jgi:hypothetical protein
MDCAGYSASHSSIGISNHVALGDMGTYSLRVLYGRPRAASHLSLFRRTNRLIASRRGELSLLHQVLCLSMEASCPDSSDHQMKPLHRENGGSGAVFAEGLSLH